eukprot:scaffold265282_cov36-Tisochrysis_lutea.AAC.3
MITFVPAISQLRLSEMTIIHNTANPTRRMHFEGFVLHCRMHESDRARDGRGVKGRGRGGVQTGQPDENNRVAW